ncbi:MAG TPA: hypothetical protein VI854_09420 [Acidimicrobiia bacterium]|nr:hypothetical protein [Acidimicrobiia bacterium]
MKPIRTLLCTSALALVPLTALPATAHESGGGEEKDDPVAAVVCSVDGTHEGCAAEEPKPEEQPAEPAAR